MPDIAMCLNADCQLRGTCYRYLAFPSMKQSYTAFVPNEDGESCDSWEPVGTDAVRTIEAVDSEATRLRASIQAARDDARAEGARS
jgi:hypothetical protein